MRPPPRYVPDSTAAPTLGELKAHHNEAHLCRSCDHEPVCAIAAPANEANALVTISLCLHYRPTDKAIDDEPE